MAAACVGCCDRLCGISGFLMADYQRQSSVCSLMVANWLCMLASSHA
jgi:hypothetical protein